MSQGIPAPASELKGKAASLYRKGSFAEANDVYRSIIVRYDNKVPAQFIRTIRCNRAACFIELGEYHSAIVELDHIFWRRPGSDPVLIHEKKVNPIFHKAYFRKAHCLFELGKGAEALEELNEYRTLVDGNVDDAEPLLREKIQSSIGKSSDKESTTSNMRRLLYFVHVFGQDLPVMLTGTAPQELIALKFANEAGTIFLKNLIKKHDKFVMDSNTEGWRCWKCSKPAESLTHSPTSSSVMEDPEIIDFALPVCKTRGPCDMEARRGLQADLGI